MRYRPLGQSGIDASVVGLGTWAIGGWMWGGTDKAAAIKAIQAGLDAGITLVDTAPIYGFGVSEEIVGEAIRGRRDGLVLATKCGLVWHVEGGDHFFDSDERRPTEGGARHVYKYLAPAAIRYEVEQSLRRLGTDVIDLYQTHWQESTTPIADTMGELLKLKDEGKIRAIGVSNANPEQLDEYRAVGAIDSDQERYSMVGRGHEGDLLPYCAEHGSAFLAYSPLSLGLLTGKITAERRFEEGDQRKGNPSFSAENLARVAQMIEAFGPVRERYGLSQAQLAIAWTIHQRGCSHALVGARTPRQAVENAGAGDIELDSEALQLMEAVIDRYADGKAQ